MEWRVEGKGDREWGGRKWGQGGGRVATGGYDVGAKSVLGCGT